MIVVLDSDLGPCFCQTAVSLRGFADVRVPLAPTANLLRLSGLNDTGDFKSVPSVATVEEPTLLNLSGLDGKRETPSIPRARSNTTGNVSRESYGGTSPRGVIIHFWHH